MVAGESQWGRPYRATHRNSLAQRMWLSSMALWCSERRCPAPKTKSPFSWKEVRPGLEP